jgi:hypothetical protein
MSIEYVGGTSKGWVNAGGTHSLTSLAGGIDTQPRTGDYIIVAACNGTSTRTVGDYPTISGNNSGAYSSLSGGELFSNAAEEAHLIVYAKFAGGTPDTELTHGPSAFSTDGAALVVHVWRGVNPIDTLDVASVGATGINSSRPDPPSITPVTAGSVVVVVGAGVQADASTAFTTSGLSNVVQNFSGATVKESRCLVGSVAWTSGAVNIAQFGGMASNSDNAWCSFVMALREAVNLLAETLADADLDAEATVTVPPPANFPIRPALVFT